MAEIHDRIVEVRKFYGETQSDFAEKICLKRSSLTNIETARCNVTDRVINDICKTYGVNREWLETGQGEMLVEQTRDERIAAFVGQALSDEGDEFKRDLIGLLAALDEDGWQKLKEAAEALKRAADNPE